MSSPLEETGQVADGSSCKLTFELCEVNGSKVIGVLNAETNKTVFVDDFGIPWCGDPEDLVNCAKSSQGSASCCITFQACTPEGLLVLGSLDPVTGESTRKNLDGSDWTGDPATLVSCTPEDVDTSVEIESTLIQRSDNADGSITYTIQITETGDGPNATPVHIIPFDIPAPAEEKVFTFVEYDENVHTLGVITPNAEGLCEIPLCCDIEPADCDFPTVNTSCTIGLVDISDKSGGSSKSPTTQNVVFNSDVINLNQANWGAQPYENANSTSVSDFSPPYTINFPTVSGRAYIVHVTWGDTNFSTGFGLTSTGSASGGLATNKICEYGSYTGAGSGLSSIYNSYYCFDGDGSNQNFSIGFPQAASSNPTGMVVATVTEYDGITCSDLAPCIPVDQVASDIVLGTSIDSNPVSIPAGSSCALWFGGAMHVVNPSGSPYSANWSEISTSGSGTTTENYDYATGDNNAGVCQIAQTGGVLVDAQQGDSIILTSSPNNGAGSQEDHGGYVIFPIVDPPNTPGVSDQFVTAPCSSTIVVNPCDEQKNLTCVMTFDAAISTSGGDVIEITPFLDGVPGPTTTTSGTVPHSGSFTVAPNGTGSCNFSFRVRCIGAPDAGTSVSINNINVTISE